MPVRARTRDEPPWPGMRAIPTQAPSGMPTSELIVTAATDTRRLSQAISPISMLRIIRAASSVRSPSPASRGVIIPHR